MLSKAHIEAAAERCSFKVQDYESHRGNSVRIDLKDERTDRAISIEIWPDSTEDDLTYLLTRAAFETRGSFAHVGSAADWMM